MDRGVIGIYGEGVIMFIRVRGRDSSGSGGVFIRFVIGEVFL